MMKFIILVVWVFSLVHLTVAQDIQVNRQNKTISITADESISADAEVAVISVGYHNYGSSQDTVFQENVRTSNVIAKALLDSGIPKENIETEKLNLNRVEQDEKWTPDVKKDRQFEAQQIWRITLPVSRAQTTVNLAVKSGANQVEDVEWNVVDPVALQAKASGAALAKAHAVAEQMAKGLGAKLGELVYASNRAPANKFFHYYANLNTDSATVSSTRVENKAELTLFPQKVKSDATVYAVFAIE